MKYARTAGHDHKNSNQEKSPGTVHHRAGMAIIRKRGEDQTDSEDNGHDPDKKE
jgi:hypothetical protein